MAAFDAGQDEDDVIAAINIIPFVDIVLVLLIIFMVTSSAIVRSALRVDLPQAASASDSVPATANVVYTKTGELYLDGDVVTKQALGAELASRVAVTPTLQVVISADKTIAYGEVVGIIDWVKQSGVKTFALNIEKTAKPQAG